MNTAIKALKSCIKKRIIEIKKRNMEVTGKYELPPKWKLIERIKESEMGCIKFHFDLKAELNAILMDAVNTYGFSLRFAAASDEIFESLLGLGINRKKYVSINYDEYDEEFVLRTGINPINEKESDTKKPLHYCRGFNLD